MAYYLVSATAKDELLTELRERLDSGEIEEMRPFGRALHKSLTNARLNEEGTAVWEEEDYCIPPLDMERRAVLDTYFTDLSVKKVNLDEGWEAISHLPDLWKEKQIESS